MIRKSKAPVYLSNRIRGAKGKIQKVTSEKTQTKLNLTLNSWLCVLNMIIGVKLNLELREKKHLTVNLC